MVDEQELHETEVAEDDYLAPTGLWAGAPSLAASTVAMENTSGWPVEVGISSGTVTVVKKNGVTLTATTSGRIHLRDGGTIAITYSVAPTLQWLYH